MTAGSVGPKQLIVNLLDRVDWLSLPVDVKGTIYEELLSVRRRSPRGGQGNISPRARLSKRCAMPRPEDRICDPAAGTGGFLCNAYRYMLDRFEMDLDRDQKRALEEELVEGAEFSPKVGHMCAMNVYLTTWLHRGATNTPDGRAAMVVPDNVLFDL
jgi:type I restriction enzyme M protein